jgi:hypothetical protein
MLKAGHPVEFTTEEHLDPLVPFREHLIRVPVGLPHDASDLSDVVGRYILMEQVAHRVHEDSS